jgi:hypothetical protein
MISTQKNAQSQKPSTEVHDFASWKTDQLIRFAHESLQKINDLEDQVSHMRQDLRSALQAYRAILKEQEDLKTQKASTSIT